ncbi:HTH-type transcriptional regulator ZntR [Roseovarius sp. A-2]|uniref:MerR family transcriptional regulator n=1 Tax=Roseovarius sp. A-2 TaxID=1570360 RepID=UPI0009B57133|nr:MerR family transcriptional regulator [Roseovarius sp. A-2]GAW34180.1 HTH-type transcriptional regulator ZntR [Roseovarius sp. A-2]
MAETHDKKQMKIGELARRSRLSERSLRHYEDLGILKPERSEGGTRTYGERDVALAKLIQSMRNLDIPLEVVAAIAGVRAKHATGAGSSHEVAAKLNELSENLMLMARLAIEIQGEVNGVLSAVNECRGCTNRPSRSGCPTCPMNAVSEASPLADMIWRGESA